MSGRHFNYRRIADPNLLDIYNEKEDMAVKNNSIL